MKKIYLEGAKICTAHGVKGILKVEHLCDSPKVLCGVKRVFLSERDGSYSEHKVNSASPSGEFVLMGIEGVDSREAAIAMRGKMIYLHRDDIPLKKGDMFIADMIGLPVKDIDTGAVYGEISDVTDGVRYKLYTVTTPEGKSVILPGVDEFIKEITEEGGMLVRLIPGFFD